MDIAVIYESIFGNTKTVAEAIAEGARSADPDAHVTVLPAAEATPEKFEQATLVVVGGPTHMLGMSRASSRAKAPEMTKKKTTGADVAAAPPRAVEGPGIREWLDALPKTDGGHKAAAFDTRLPFPLAGGAARPIARKLRRRGYSVVAGPKGFVVDEAEGPLRAGEQDRAKAWGAGLVRQAAR
ncbi:MAG TPA: flavodoxin domain-containing protein [Streptosporangiaceae bacterium]|nr:flavodoxin domain-containing protein [Streptosporangiaceae bacterium]